MEAHPRLKVSRRCLDAVDVLRKRYGIADASPFSYVSGLSPHLNVYCEPPEFLDEADRDVFQPLAFYGSLPAREEWDRVDAGDSYFDGTAAEMNVLHIVRYRHLGLQGGGGVCRTPGARRRPPAARERQVISLGNANVAGELRESLAAPGVSVETYVDQWRILREGHLFVTHHGLNSTHEAIVHRVPMLSYPFVWDQPGLAATCQRLRLAVPIVGEPMAAVTPSAPDTALRIVRRERDAMLDALAVASDWEREVVAGRPAVLQRILAQAT